MERSRILTARETPETAKGERGTGMGLATCEAVGRRHGGKIEVKRGVGNGSTFNGRLPVSV